MEDELAERIEEVARLLAQASNVVAFTGAGVSTESGIPDFRGRDGLWTRYDPDDFTYQKFVSDPEARKRIWRGLTAFGEARRAEPNACHYALAELYRLGKLDCVITQNVDGLHQQAGVPEEKVIELHGTTRYVKCLSCGKRYPSELIAERLKEEVEDPTCDECGGMLKSAAIFFGEAMPLREVAEAQRHSQACDLMLVLGSSLVVYPAAYMPAYAVQSGARLAIINLEPTPMDEHADVCIDRKVGEMLPTVVDTLKRRLT
ncbi:MAG: NAD-dependent protein deacylase [Chloroflexota bacterium]